MATHKSAEKRARQSVRRAKRNNSKKGAIRSFEKKITTAIAASDKNAATTLLNDYMGKATKAAIKGVIHAKAASRKISRLAARISKISAAK